MAYDPKDPVSPLDPDEQDEEKYEDRPSKSGSLPESRQPVDWRRISRFAKRNMSVFLVLVLICGAALAAAIWLAFRAAAATKHQALNPPPISVNSRVPAASGLPMVNSSSEFGPPGTQGIPQGMDPAEYQRYLAWKAACAAGKCGQQTNQPSAAEKRRQQIADLEWKARIAAPDDGNKRSGNQTASNTPQSVPEPSSAATAPVKTPEEQIKPADWNGPSDQNYLLLAGLTPIKARLITAITGDVKGPMIAEVTEPVYSWDFTKLLVPKGSFLTGHYDRVMEQDQERVLVQTDSLTMPDGWRITFPPIDVLDQRGMAALKDKVNHHYTQLFLTSIGLATISAGAQFGGGNSYTYSPVDVMRIGFGIGASQAAQQAFSRFAYRRPTLTIRAGNLITIVPPIDVPIPEWSKHDVRTPL